MTAQDQAKKLLGNQQLVIRLKSIKPVKIMYRSCIIHLLYRFCKRKTIRATINENNVILSTYLSKQLNNASTEKLVSLATKLRAT